MSKSITAPTGDPTPLPFGEVGRTRAAQLHELFSHLSDFANLDFKTVLDRTDRALNIRGGNTALSDALFVQGTLARLLCALTPEGDLFTDLSEHFFQIAEGEGGAPC